MGGNPCFPLGHCKQNASLFHRGPWFIGSYFETRNTEYNKKTFVKEHHNPGKQTNLIFKCITWRHWLRGHRVPAAPGATDGTTWHICSFPGSCLGCGTAGLGSRERLWVALYSPLWQSKSWLHLNSRQQIPKLWKESRTVTFKIRSP